MSESAANGQDLCFLNIDLVGENGITKSSVDQVLKVEVTGAGCLQGYGSARQILQMILCPISTRLSLANPLLLSALDMKRAVFM